MMSECDKCGLIYLGIWALSTGMLSYLIRNEVLLDKTEVCDSFPTQELLFSCMPLGYREHLNLGLWTCTNKTSEMQLDLLCARNENVPIVSFEPTFGCSDMNSSGHMFCKQKMIKCDIYQSCKPTFYQCQAIRSLCNRFRMQTFPEAIATAAILSFLALLIAAILLSFFFYEPDF
jgi:hypothetical protein